VGLAPLTVGIRLEHESVIALEEVLPCCSRLLVEAVAIRPGSTRGHTREHQLSCPVATMHRAAVILVGAQARRLNPYDADTNHPEMDNRFLLFVFRWGWERAFSTKPGCKPARCKLAAQKCGSVPPLTPPSIQHFSKMRYFGGQDAVGARVLVQYTCVVLQDFFLPFQNDLKPRPLVERAVRAVG